jgi:hypothetical protein
VANPTHFLIISSRSEIDFAGSTLLVDQNESLRPTMMRIVRAAQDCGRLRPGLDHDDLVLSLRALTYGTARLWADGHFPQWQVNGDPAAAMRRMIDLFLASISVADG